MTPVSSAMPMVVAPIVEFLVEMVPLMLLSLNQMTPSPFGETARPVMETTVIVPRVPGDGIGRFSVMMAVAMTVMVAATIAQVVAIVVTVMVPISIIMH